jgi:hypothetical protein
MVTMFEVYFDDSGTDSSSEIAIAACYVSTKRGWDEFTREWDCARNQEGFDEFHMAHFLAPRNQAHKPYCDWDNTKKDHVYARLAKIINENKRIGIACAVPKQLYDDLVPERMRRHHGGHYPFAVWECIIKLERWREKSLISLPMRVVFDWEEAGSPKRKEISQILDTMEKGWAKRLGMEDEDSYSFEHHARSKPLQAADILAWQMNNHMRRIFPGPDKAESAHEGFKLLREDQEMNLVFFTEENLRAWVKKIEDDEAAHGLIYK